MEQSDSFCTTRTCVAVVPINHAFLIIGDSYQGTKTVEATKTLSVTAVEKETVTLDHTMATMATKNNTHIMQ